MRTRLFERDLANAGILSLVIPASEIVITLKVSFSLIPSAINLSPSSPTWFRFRFNLDNLILVLRVLAMAYAPT